MCLFVVFNLVNEISQFKFNFIVCNEHKTIKLFAKLYNFRNRDGLARGPLIWDGADQLMTAHKIQCYYHLNMWILVGVSVNMWIYVCGGGGGEKCGRTQFKFIVKYCVASFSSVVVVVFFPVVARLYVQ